MKTAIGMVCLLVLVLASVLTAAADTRYVSDRLFVTVRDSKAPGSEVLATVTSNDPVQVLEEGEDFLKIRTREGVVGFIRAQYITKETPKPVIIGRLEKEIDRLNAQIEQLRAGRSPGTEEVESLRERAQSLENALAEARSELESVTGKYNTLMGNSGRVGEITAENEKLQEENQRLTAKLDNLEEENTQLLRQGMLQWFLAGAGVFLVGWIIGKISRKKRRF